MPNTDYEYLDFLLLARNADFVEFSEISKTDRCWLAGMGCVHSIPEATIGSGGGPGIVLKDLTKIMRVRRIFIDRN